MAGLLHDADWDQWPDEHCKKIIEDHHGVIYAEGKENEGATFWILLPKGVV